MARRAGFGGGVVVDYPNSKKARKVFLCLFVGSGSQVDPGKALALATVLFGIDASYSASAEQLPCGLEGDEGMDGDGDEVRFERKRERERRRSEKRGKRKGVKVKDKEWILKKKEVCFTLPYDAALYLTLLICCCSSIDNEERRMYPETQNLLEESGGQCFDVGHKHASL